MLITVLTPTYNRASLLNGAYQSLSKQTYIDFEWLIIDDGSQDDTEVVAGEMQKYSSFPIRYYKKKNGGKHTALNVGVKNAKGELIVMLDSDDELMSDALQKIAEVYDTVKDDSSFGGVCGVMAHRNGKLISSLPNDGYLDCNEVDARYKYHITGDLCEVFRTSVFREFPFPEIPGEKFCPEALVWLRIARKYKLRFFNEVIYIRDYLEGGLTSKIVKIRRESPKASRIYYRELLQLDIPWKYKMRGLLNLIRYTINVI